jgi:DNA-binding NtrC family response regulator
MSMTLESRPYYILIVDDLPGQRLAVRTALDAAVRNCEFVEAGSVAEAETALGKSPHGFDLAVIDMRLPGKGQALPVLDALLKRSVLTRAIIITAYPELETACPAYEKGAAVYISKIAPDYTRRLQEKARELLEQRRQREEIRRQVEAQRRADAAFEGHRKEWMQKYAGRFVMVRNGEVIDAKDNPVDLLETLNKLCTDDRLEIGIIEVPRSEETHGEN